MWFLQGVGGSGGVRRAASYMECYWTTSSIGGFSWQQTGISWSEDGTFRDDISW